MESKSNGPTRMSSQLSMRGFINVIGYIDDLLVHSKNHAKHQKQLEKLFSRLRNTGLKANIKNVSLDQTMLAI
jgi:hypothetical protein